MVVVVVTTAGAAVDCICVVGAVAIALAVVGAGGVTELVDGVENVAFGFKKL
jgi:hypothetical protein